jgi:hypothetical protein
MLGGLRERILEWLFAQHCVKAYIRARRPKLTVSKSPSPGHPLYVIVHGTWARKADTSWAAKEKPLFEALTNRDHDCGVAFFRWSGGNRLGARMRAAKKLAGRMLQLNFEFPGSHVVAISHSHGGNVVLWASELLNVIRTAVYINTPFSLLNATGDQQMVDELRGSGHRIDSVEVKKSGDSEPAALFFAWFALPLWVLGKLALTLPVSWSPYGIPLVLIGGFVAFAVIGWWRYLRTSIILYGLTSLGREERAQAHELVIHTVGDEPLTLMTSLYAGIRLLQPLARPLLIGISFLWMMCWFPLGDMPKLRDSVACAGAYALLIVWVPVLLAVVLYGLRQGLLALRQGLVVSATPLNRVEALTVTAMPTQWGQFRHSMVLTDPNVVDAIVDWLNQLPPLSDEERNLRDVFYGHDPSKTAALLKKWENSPEASALLKFVLRLDEEEDTKAHQ